MTLASEHYRANLPKVLAETPDPYRISLMSACPKHAWGGVKAMRHSVFDQIDTDAVHA